MAWKEMGFLDDTPSDAFARDAKPTKWVEVTAKAVGVEASEE